VVTNTLLLLGDLTVDLLFAGQKSSDLTAFPEQDH
jgi:hypothetical protein